MSLLILGYILVFCGYLLLVLLPWLLCAACCFLRLTVLMKFKHLLSLSSRVWWKFQRFHDVFVCVHIFCQNCWWQYRDDRDVVDFRSLLARYLTVFFYYPVLIPDLTKMLNGIGCCNGMFYLLTWHKTCRTSVNITAFVCDCRKTWSTRNNL